MENHKCGIKRVSGYQNLRISLTPKRKTLKTKKFKCFRMTESNNSSLKFPFVAVLQNKCKKLLWNEDLIFYSEKRQKKMRERL